MAVTYSVWTIATTLHSKRLPRMAQTQPATAGPLDRRHLGVNRGLDCPARPGRYPSIDWADSGSHEGRQYRADGLNLVVAAIVLWNTIYLGRVGCEGVDKRLFAYMAPSGWQHVNLTGDDLWGESRNDPRNRKPLRQKFDVLDAA
jgi:hypothetical protein